MKVESSEIENGGPPSKKQRTSSEQFLAQHITPNTHIKSELHEVDHVAEPFKYFNLTDPRILALKFPTDPMETTDILLENVIVEYKSGVRTCLLRGQENLMYLRTHVSVGIPVSQYNWLLNEISELSGIRHSPMYTFKDKDYVWISAQLPNNDPVYQDPDCYIYDAEKDDTVAVGLLRDVISGLKSNVLGYGRFQVQEMEDSFTKEVIVRFLLTGFQMTDLTKTQSYPKPRVPVPPSNELLDSLNKLKPNDVAVDGDNDH